jgi:hypothetical protein
VIDLDRAMAKVNAGYPRTQRHELEWLIRDLVAEIRAARDARDEIDRLYEDDRIHLDEEERLFRLLAAWDKAAGGGS